MENKVYLDTDLNHFSIKDRIMMRFKGSPTLLDRAWLPDVAQSVLDLGFGYTRAELPKSMIAYDTKGIEIPFSRNIMLNVTKKDNGFEFVRVPGLHVVTGQIDNGEYYDPFNRFKNILTNGFSGNKRINTYLLTKNYKREVQQFGYTGNASLNLHIHSKLEQSYGDYYKLLLWVGFTKNYLVRPELDISSKPYGKGNVKNTSINNIEAYIFINPTANITSKIEYYTYEFAGLSPHNSIRLCTEAQEVYRI
jgi:hypothetical protein